MLPHPLEMQGFTPAGMEAMGMGGVEHYAERYNLGISELGRKSYP